MYDYVWFLLSLLVGASLARIIITQAQNTLLTGQALYVMASVLRVNTIGHVRSMLARAHVPLHFNVWVECFVLPVKDEGDVLFVKVGTI